MRITILNGNPNSKNYLFDEYVNNIAGLLKSKNNTVDVILLRERNLQYCLGCFDCWLKTPGECVMRDDSRDICRKYINSDFVLFASPIISGFSSALLKKTQDKLIPLLHPYFEIMGGEFHHMRRYKRYPSLGLLLEKNTGVDEENINIISNIYSRIALKFKSKLRFLKFITDAPQEVVNEIGCN
ncbi:MAG: NAD(P)H-dependent oxidoreductase [Candidatus Omnitrophica bacterium]|nr:NAD(P)H-dependent oxidoreductase [Candidatus Omnitrophota bacterium]MBU1929756.1 NAD(P)H-dependent oxidoreductase [Candidatus Omnitrophota bacterium]MBU2034921.1 NAD(P)H-dependent oxidoreductase [Candidatus Omnitrophota bacterium]MBU2258269.1 NAD(P)H-dependent oxidoreductase [Candidatus Omnitrophota bacterium]